MNIKNEAYSVIIPAYNAENTIAAAIDSTLTQSIMPQEIIVIDDGSSDKTCEIAFAYAPIVRVISQPNQGPGKATNHGIQLAKEKLLAFLDSDDIWLPHKMEVQLNAFAQQEYISAILSHVEDFKDDVLYKTESYAMWGRSTMLIKTEDAKLIGDIIDFPGNLGDMIDWIKRGQELGLIFHMLPDVLVKRRIRIDSLSYGRSAEKDRGYIFAVKRALDRMREKKS